MFMCVYLSEEKCVFEPGECESVSLDRQSCDWPREGASEHMSTRVGTFPH